MTDEGFMRLAVEQAALAELAGEVPVGCVLVSDGEVIASGRNLREAAQDPTAHAEMVSLRAAAARMRSWRLLDVTCYVTLEPCAMCAGALVHARLARVVYGCDDPKAGAVRSLYAIGQDGRLNHKFELTTGVLAEACAEQLSAFFRRVRVGQKQPG